MRKLYDFPVRDDFRLASAFFAVRHGESTANVAKIVSSDPDIATKSHGLTALGRKQAENAGDAFVNLVRRNGWKNCLIVTSDFKRARETAEILMTRLSTQLRVRNYCYEFRIDERLRERSFGEYEGKESHKSYHKVWARDKVDASSTDKNVESVLNVRRRGIDLVLDLNRERRHGLPWDVIVVVAHGDTLQILQSAFTRTDGRLHRSLPHLANAILRELILAPPHSGASLPQGQGSPLSKPRCSRLLSGYMMPLVGFGCARLKGRAAVDSIRHAIRCGVRHFDSAKLYGNEEIVGLALKEAMTAGEVRRQDLFITSKLWNDDHGSVESVSRACRNTLIALGLDYLDLYLIHWPVHWEKGSLAVPFTHLLPGFDFHFQDLVRTWGYLEKMQRLGLVRSIGVSNFPRHLLDRFIRHVSVLPSVNQIETHPRFPQHNLVEYCRGRGIICTAWSPLAQCHQSIVKASSSSSSSSTSSSTPSSTSSSAAAVSSIGVIAERHGVSCAQVALAWNVARGLAVIPRSTSPSHIEENSAAHISALSLQFSSEEVESIGQCLDKGFWGRLKPDILGIFNENDSSSSSSHLFLMFCQYILSFLVRIFVWLLFALVLPRCIDLRMPQWSFSELLLWDKSQGGGKGRVVVKEALRLFAVWVILLTIYMSV